jgi:hypothetical protein
MPGFSFAFGCVIGGAGLKIHRYARLAIRRCRLVANGNNPPGWYTQVSDAIGSGSFIAGHMTRDPFTMLLAT